MYMHSSKTASPWLGGRKSLSAIPESAERRLAPAQAVGAPDAAAAALVINTEFAVNPSVSPAVAGGVSSSNTGVNPPHTQNNNTATVRLERFAAQAFARSLLPASRVGMCLRLQLAGRVEARYSPSKGSARLGGVAVCGLGWVCPVCAVKIAERRRSELDEALTAWRRRGGVVLMATLTFSHTRQNELAPTLDAVLAAYRYMTSSARYKALRAFYDLQHTVRALELTWGNAYGWHPHFHVLTFHGVDVDRAALEDDLYECWSPALATVGLAVDRKFVHVRRTDDAADQYVAKWGRAWTAADELTKAHVKRGRHNHYTPFDLLRLGAAGKGWAVYRFEEYVKATAGRSQLQWSRGLRGALGLAAPTPDLEVAAAVEADELVLAALDVVQYKAILHFHRVGHLHEVIRSGDPAKVRVFVDHWHRRYLQKKGFPNV